MDLRCTIILFFLLATIVYGNGHSARSKRRLSILDFRKMMKVFVRYNVKVNVLPYTSIFAFAAGFRANWDIKPPKLVSHRRISQPEYVLYDANQDHSRYQNGQYQEWYQPKSSYQRALHSAVQEAFDWHGLNGFACLQRTVCEVGTLHHDDVISQMFRIVFNGTDEVSCPEELDCPISLLELVDHILTGSTNAVTQ